MVRHVYSLVIPTRPWKKIQAKQVHRSIFFESTTIFYCNNVRLFTSWYGNRWLSYRIPLPGANIYLLNVDSLIGLNRSTIVESLSHTVFKIYLRMVNSYSNAKIINMYFVYTIVLMETLAVYMRRNLRENEVRLRECQVYIEIKGWHKECLSANNKVTL